MIAMYSWGSSNIYFYYFMGKFWGFPNEFIILMGRAPEYVFNQSKLGTTEIQKNNFPFNNR